MSTLYIGLDVHKETITVAVAEEGRDGEIRSYGTFENTPASVDRLIRRLAKSGRTLHFCYEAGCCGYGLHRQITAAGHLCDVIAPSMIPRKPGEHVKTDRRDAIKLARLLRAGELDVVWVPDAAHEAMRDLVRARAAANIHLKTSKQQLQSFLLRHGRIYSGVSSWSRAHYTWLAVQKFEQPAHQIVFQDYINAIHDGEKREGQLIKQIENLLPHWRMKPLVDALCLMKGLNLIASATVLSVTGDLRRFPTPTEFSGYTGLVPSEHSSGNNVKRRGITKAEVASSRATAAQATGASLPAAINRRYRPHNLTWAFQATSHSEEPGSVWVALDYILGRSPNPRPTQDRVRPATTHDNAVNT